MYVDVVLELPVDSAFTYCVENVDRAENALYRRVEVPFRKGTKRGVIIRAFHDKPSFEVKSVSAILDEAPLFGEETLELANWIKDFYLCSLGEALFTILPREIKEKKDIIPVKKTVDLLELNDEQELAVSRVVETIEKQEHKAFLLYGITGSGKTEVYRHIAAHCRKLGKASIILVPEIALTPQTVKRFAEIFGERIAVIHSRLNPREKLYHWKRIRNQEVDIILGARSAVFAPVPHPGCIIIDEEHEASYKASDTPKYNARQAAFYLAAKNKIPLVLGSATPQIESFYHAESGRLELLTLKKRFAKEQMTDVRIINMTGEKGVFHPELIKKVLERINKGEQTILFLNRRGFVPYVSCNSCGESVKCSHCSVSLTYHKNKNALICHQCSSAVRVPSRCPVCHSEELNFIGAGTEKIEDLLAAAFPQARIKRMDFDTTRGKKGHEKLLDSLGKGEIDILVGTQMVAKGLHFPNVTLVGVIDADIALNLPEFRAGERVFSLLVQVSGRAGRGDIKGEVIIQTRNPASYVIDYAAKSDYKNFYEKEKEIRRETGFPPFSRIVRLVLRGTDERMVEEKLRQAVLAVGAGSGVELLGPAECPLSKLNKYYRRHVILRGADIKPLLIYAKKYKDYFISDSSVYLEIDPDPFSML